MLNGKEKANIYLPDLKGNYFWGKIKIAHEAAFVQARSLASFPISYLWFVQYLLNEKVSEGL